MTLLPISANAGEEDAVLYVIRGDVVVSDNHLSITPGHVEWFTDRPAHDAGRITVAKFQDVWQSGFDTPAPNAALVGDSTNAIVELNSLSIDGKTMRFGYQVLRGVLLDAELSEGALFIDSNIDTGMDSL